MKKSVIVISVIAIVAISSLGGIAEYKILKDIDRRCAAKAYKDSIELKNLELQNKILNSRLDTTSYKEGIDWANK